MTKRELRELIKSTIKEYSGGNSTDGNSRTSQRDPGGSFKTEKGELDFYNDQNAGEGGQGLHTRGMEKRAMGNPNSQKQVRF